MLDLNLKPFEKFSLPETIIGEKCIFVKRTHTYDEALFHLINESRHFLREFLFWVDDTKTLDDVKTVTDIFSKNFDEQNSFEYVFLDKETKELVGAGGIHTVSYMNRMAEYGYYLSHTATGRGYASDFVASLEKELFAHGIHRLVIECDANNKASAAVAKRNGFEYEGCLKGAKYAYGGYRDEFVFGKINPSHK